MTHPILSRTQSRYLIKIPVMTTYHELNQSSSNGKLNSAMGWLKFDSGVATTSRLLKIIDLFCRILSLLQGSFAKETYHFKESTNRSHSISPNMTNTRWIIGVCHELNQMISSQFQSWPHIANCHKKNSAITKYNHKMTHPIMSRTQSKYQWSHIANCHTKNSAITEYNWHNVCRHQT